MQWIDRPNGGAPEAPLPVWQLHSQLLEAWRVCNRIVLVAPTGSGKSTQICRMILQDNRHHDRMIVVLQPRRVAARTVARRVAAEMGVEVGREVGYQVRFEDAIAPETRIAFITEGILLRWLQDDPTLSRVGAVLFDEFHERNLLSDIGLGLVKSLQQQARPDLLLMVMSATLDAVPVRKYLGDCPLLEAQDRSYPVEIRYQEWADERPVWELAVEKVREIVDRSAGDILVFMPGAYEIQRTMDEIRRARINDDLVVLPLHGELSPQDQDRAFLPSPYRRIIVSTNVAETSVTIPGIGYVIDSGQARISRYDTEHGIRTLHIEPISQASADQRAGRAGRLGPGLCYRLWTKNDQSSRPANLTPEIQRTELSEVVLLLHSFGISDVEHFDLLDQPGSERIHQAEILLETLGAVTTEPHHITDIGRRMLRLPIHPRYARMLIEAEKYDCVREVALFAVLVSGRDLLVRLNREEKSALRNRDSLTRTDQSDFYLLAASYQHAIQHRLDYKACYSFGVNPHVAREVALTYHQMQDLLSMEQRDDLPLKVNENIQKCHLVGFIDQLALRRGGSDEFDLASGYTGTLMQESLVKRNSLIVVSEIREITTHQGERLTLIGTASAIKPEWVRELNPPQYSQTTEHVYNRLNRRVVAGSVMRYGNLIIGGSVLDQVDPAAAGEALAKEFIRNPQPASVPLWERELRPWLLHVKRMKKESPELGLPEFNDELITICLARAWQGAASYKEAAARPLLPSFNAILTADQRMAVEKGSHAK